jgi:hypothetical protein
LELALLIVGFGSTVIVTVRSSRTSSCWFADKHSQPFVTAFVVFTKTSLTVLEDCAAVLAPVTLAFAAVSQE